MTDLDKHNRPTLPVSACPEDSLLTARCNLELLRRRESELEAATVRALMDSMDIKTLCRAMASGDERRARMAFVLLTFVGAE